MCRFDLLGQNKARRRTPSRGMIRIDFKPLIFSQGIVFTIVIYGGLVFQLATTSRLLRWHSIGFSIIIAINDNNYYCYFQLLLLMCLGRHRGWRRHRSNGGTGLRAPILIIILIMIILLYIYIYHNTTNNTNNDNTIIYIYIIIQIIILIMIIVMIVTISMISLLSLLPLLVLLLLLMRRRPSCTTASPRRPNKYTCMYIYMYIFIERERER